MKLSTVRPVIRSLLASLAGVAEAQVVWRDGPRGFNAPVMLLPRLTTVPGGMQDERMISYDADAEEGEEITESINEERYAVLSIRCERLGFADESAFEILEKVRTGLSRTSSTLTLNAVKAAYVSCLSINDLTDVVPIDQRTHSIAVMDLRMRLGDSTPGDKTGYIESIGVNGTTIPLEEL